MFRALQRIRLIGGSTSAQFNRVRPIYATMAITQNEANTLSVTATANDETTPPPLPVAAGPGPFNGYVKVGGYALERAKEITFSDNALTLPNDGVYAVNIGWATFRHSQNSSIVSFLLAVEREGVLTFSQRPTGSRVPNVGDPANIGGGGTLDAQAGDIVSVWLASSKTGTVTVPNSNVTIQMLEDTSA